MLVSSEAHRVSCLTVPHSKALRRIGRVTRPPGSQQGNRRVRFPIRQARIPLPADRRGPA
ncbi:hypothetical protein CBM2599_A80023 [Cupriavidus taiwanensis]|uniref:Uncharacterized protein n=1 Tax=Cupriavidus taiwanensis TaxID=164546 RepID=A0A375D315_9BURK|nr:hypothetical protein CBM2599_A80023 [Cupriavidus taiwanensis]SOY92379.1 hypothetical protein CBM2600_A90023 [Cupriavidus taiwanensis]SPD64343.1 protein of unknown function [Cupriavidus taiwanensis]